MKAVDVQKNNFTASYPQFPYPRGEVKEYNDQLIGTQTEAEALAHMEFAEGNRGYTVSLVCGMADWLERGMKVKLNLANIDTNGTTFQNKGFLVNTWEESIAFGSPDWTTTIDLIEAKVF